MARLQEFYRDKVVPDLVTKFGYKSSMQVPRVSKITLNMGVSEAVSAGCRVTHPSVPGSPPAPAHTTSPADVSSSSIGGW